MNKDGHSPDNPPSLRESQKFYINRFIRNPIGGLPLDCGLGKTRIMLEVIDYLIKHQIIETVLIIATIPVIEYTWPEEIKKWKFNLTYHNLRDNPSPSVGTDIYLLNMEAFSKKDYPLLITDMIIFDESTFFRNHSSKRFKTLKKYIHLYKRRYALTATLVPRSLINFWTQTYLLDLGERLEKNITAFRKKYCYKGGFRNYDWLILPGKEKEILEEIKDIWYHIEAKKNPKETAVFQIIPTLLTQEETIKYKELKKTGFTNIEGNIKLKAFHASSKRALLRALASGSCMFQDKFIEFSDNKIIALKQLIEELGNKTLMVAYNFNLELDRLQREFGKNIPVIRGGMKKNEMSKILASWKAGEIPLLFVQPCVLSHGLNLQLGGHHLCWYSPPDDWDVYYQLNKRLDRPGQTHLVVIHNISTQNTVDEIAYNTLMQKEDVATKVNEALYQNIL